MCQKCPDRAADISGRQAAELEPLGAVLSAGKLPDDGGGWGKTSIAYGWFRLRQYQNHTYAQFSKTHGAGGASLGRLAFCFLPHSSSIHGQHLRDNVRRFLNTGLHIDHKRLPGIRKKQLPGA